MVHVGRGEPKSCGLKRITPIVVQSLVHDKGEVSLVRRGARKERDHSLWRVSGFGGKTAFLSFSDCATNVLTALRERVFYHVVQGVVCVPRVPSRELVRNSLSRFAALFRREAFLSIPVNVGDYHMCYVGSKRALYERAAKRVALEGWRRSWSVLKTFIKHEKIPELAKRAVPRVIQPRTPEYNVVVGRFLRHLEHPIYRIIDHVCGGPTVMKGYNAFEVGGHFVKAWSEFKRPVAVGLDASRFDQHVSRPVLEWEHSCYQMFYKGEEAKELGHALQCQLVNTGYADTPDGTYRYRKEGCRASGDMNTALGNCLIMCAMVHSYMASIGVSHWRLLNNGDDCVVIVEEEALAHLSTLPEWFDNLGFVMVVESPVRVLEEIEFCQSHPVFDGEHWRMVRNVRVALSKDATFLSGFGSESEYSSYRYVVAQGGLSLCSGLPMMQQYYKTFGRGARAGTFRDKRVLDSGFMRLADRLTPRLRPISDDARVSFWRAFGFTPTEQLAWEEVFEQALPMATTFVEGAAECWQL